MVGNMSKLIALVATILTTGCVQVKHKDFTVTSFLRKSQIASATVTTNGITIKGYSGTGDRELAEAISYGVAAAMAANAGKPPTP